MLRSCVGSCPFPINHHDLLHQIHSEDAEGNVDRINQSIPQRDSFFSIAPEQADEWYTAMLSFVQMLYDGSVTLKTKPGNLLR